MASIPVFSQSRAGRPPPPLLPSDFHQNFQPPLSAFSGVMPPVGSVEDFPPSPFLPDTAEWEESDWLLSDPSEDLAYASNSASKYERVSKAPRKPVPAGAHHFRFAQPHSEKYFDTEGPSPELLALGASLSSPNALTTPSFRKEDK